MGNGIICKVWNISGETKSRPGSSQIKDSIKYILNEEKTGVVLNGEASDDFSAKQLGRECRYIENDIKTISGALVSSRNLSTTDISEAVRDMMEVKKFFGKTDGRAALHGIISLPETESNKNNSSALLQLCNDVLAELFPDHQAIFAVHTNTENLHVHFIVNSVGLNGRKIHQPKMFMKQVVQPCVNKYAKKYGFSQNEEWKKSHAESKSDFVQVKMALRKKIDIAIENSDTFEGFIKNLKDMGIETRIGKHISLITEDLAKPVRSYQLGASYSMDSIIERIRTRKSAFENFEIGNHVALDSRPDDVFKAYTEKMKKYRDMTDEEKKETIRKLKLGINPWRVNRETNWQLKNISNELNMTNRATTYIKMYSNDGSAESALDEMVSIKKEISEEKKHAREYFLSKKPVIDIYKTMHRIERKAYLYEHENEEKYRPEYEEYRELTRRLKQGYGKTYDEVGAFIEKYNDRILYANAELKELSYEYRELKKYCLSRGNSAALSSSLSDIVGIDKGNDLSRRGLFDADVKYITSSLNPGVVLKVIKSPYTDERGNVRENISVSVMTQYGEIVEQCELKEGRKEFSSFISEIEKKYDLRECQTYRNFSLAASYSRRSKDLQDGTAVPGLREYSAHKAGNKTGKTTYSFTQAINLRSAGNKQGIHVIANSSDASYLGMVVTAGEGIVFKVLDLNGIEKESFNIPSFKDRNQSGYELIRTISEKYGFSDDLYSFNDIESAKGYARGDKEKKTAGRE